MKFAKWATKVGLPKNCRINGLKKGGLRRLAESNATTHEPLPVSGHLTPAQLQVYTEEVDRKKNSRRRDRETHQERRTCKPCHPPTCKPGHKQSNRGK